MNRKSRYAFDRSYGIVPIFKRDKMFEFLLVKHRGAGPGRPGHWAFPKGHKEKGESMLAAAKRELGEENGIKKCIVDDNKRFTEKYVFKKERKLVLKTVTYFIAIVRDKKVKIQKKEIDDYAWLSFEQALGRVTFIESKKILQEVKEYLNI